MAVNPRTLSHILPVDFDLFPDSPPPPPASKRPQSHYRPFSTLHIEPDSPPRLKRASSLGGLHSFRGMNLGLTFKPKKHAGPSVTPPASPTSQSGTPSQKVSYPLSLKQRLKDGTKAPNSLLSTPIPSVKKKRSVMSLFSAASTPPEPPEPAPDTPDDPPRPSTVKSVKFQSPDEFGYDSDSDPFVRKSVWATRFNMKLHPYQTEVPYMQAYNPIQLENDRYTDLLLQRLGGGYPSFGQLRSKAPLRALDLGCGQGTWIVYASTIWSHTQYTGFDLVNITTPAFKAMDNSTFVQGNFIKFPLPFADASFDYVRLANLVLCVPYTHWDMLFREVKRILSVGGRVEVIDDEIFFPYANPPKLRDHLPSSSSPRKRHRASASSFDLDDDDLFSDADLDGDTLQGYESGEDSMFNHSETTCVSSSFDDKEQQLSASETARPSSYARWRRHASTTSASSSFSPSTASTLFSPTSTISSTSTTSDPYAKPTITDPYLAQPAHAIWAQRAAASRELEAAFIAMLSASYGVYPRPADFVAEFMQNVFGRKAGKTQTFRVRLAEWGSPIGVCADVVEGVDGKVEGEEGVGVEREGREREKKQWMAGRDSEKKKARRKEQVLGDAGLASERASVSMDVSLASPIPDIVKPKAAKQLGMDVPLGSPIPDVVKPKAAKQLGLLIPPSTLTTTSPSKSRGYSSSGSTSPSQSPGTPTSPVSFSSSSSTPTSAGTPVGSGGSSSSSLVSSRQHSPVKMTQPKAPNAKTAALLGMSYTELVAATSKALQASTASSNAQAAVRHAHHHHHKNGTLHPKHHPEQQHHEEQQDQDQDQQPQQIFRFKPAGLVQSPGLLIGRDHYIALDARELEMHACKNMHTLLGCRPALAGYVARFKDETGRLIVDEDMFAFHVWEYETFRRNRLGWPSQIPEKDDDDMLPTIDESAETSHFNSKDSNSSSRPSFSSSSSYRAAADTPQHQVFDCQPDETVHVRTIRVFQAIKMGPGEEEKEEVEFSRLGGGLTRGMQDFARSMMKEWVTEWEEREKARLEL